MEEIFNTFVDLLFEKEEETRGKELEERLREVLSGRVNTLKWEKIKERSVGDEDLSYREGDKSM